jgi:RimJ/RimL family protein N-acetyltransferase
MDDDLRTMAVSRSNPASRLTYRDGQRAVVLRPQCVSDAEAIANAARRSAPELKAFMPWAHGEISATGQLERLKRAYADYCAGRELPMGLYDEPSGAFLGCVGLHPRTPLNPAALEVGYWTASEHAGRGLATLGTRIAIAYAFELLGADRVQVMHDAANSPSRRVVEKCGFRSEGTLRNAIARASAELLAGGYRGTSETLIYALVPEDRPALDWYAPLLQRLTVHNLAGYAIPLRG